jgi:hypothetical protein
VTPRKGSPRTKNDETPEIPIRRQLRSTSKDDKAAMDSKAKSGKRKSEEEMSGSKKKKPN